MLVLSRRVDEGIDLYDAKGRKIATIMPVSIQGNKVRLGIQAVDDIKVMRAELGAPTPHPDPNLPKQTDPVPAAGQPCLRLATPVPA